MGHHINPSHPHLELFCRTKPRNSEACHAMHFDGLAAIMLDYDKYKLMSVLHVQRHVMPRAWRASTSKMALISLEMICRDSPSLECKP